MRTHPNTIIATVLHNTIVAPVFQCDINNIRGIIIIIIIILLIYVWYGHIG